MRVELLTERYQSQIAGVLSCYDRIIIQGTIPKWCYAKGMTDYFYEHNIRIFRLPEMGRAVARCHSGEHGAYRGGKRDRD
jgi:hypothetical protein